MSDTTAIPPENSFQPEIRAAWRSWLEAHHTRDAGVWLILVKKGVGLPRIDVSEAVEEALCFGWIDSKPAKLDAQRSMLWFSPRKKKSGWSDVNKKRIERMIAAGLMTPAGLAKIEAAKADSSWEKLDAISALVVPADLTEALAAYTGAADYFEAFPASAKRGILEWISNAKRPETRKQRVDETARLAAENRRANQWPR